MNTQNQRIARGAWFTSKLRERFYCYLGYEWKLFCLDPEEMKLFHEEKGTVRRIQFPVGETERFLCFSPPISFREAFDCVVQLYNSPEFQSTEQLVNVIESDEETKRVIGDTINHRWACYLGFEITGSQCYRLLIAKL